ncbi:MAG: class I SAM-dependent rRNA methyltransferase [Polyangiaceae bacterium]|nr:class I SAM-dependent rRNA methyltransferase [Polyangiaceae bacterium]
MIVTVEAGAASALMRGHPWVFREAIRGTRGKGKTGDAVRVLGPKNELIGWGLYDRDSPIAVRMYGWDRAKPQELVASGAEPPHPKAVEESLVRLVKAAIARRSGLFDSSKTTAYRLCNGEGDRIPGLVIDRYGAVAVARTDGDAMGTWIDKLAPSIARLLSADGISSLLARVEAEANERKVRSLSGEMPADTLDVLEHGMTFEVDIARGQKTGAFLDQRDNRRHVRELAKGRRRVLNLFSYAGGFSVAAALGGATEVTSVDAATRAHGTAQRSFKKNGLSLEGHQFVSADAFVFLENAAKRKDRYDLVISDPPSFAPNERSKRGALAAYARLHRACAALLADGALLCASSCSSHVGMEEFLGTLDDTALGRSDLTVLESFGAPADHPTLACFPEGRYLKFVVMG